MMKKIILIVIPAFQSVVATLYFGLFYGQNSVYNKNGNLIFTGFPFPIQTGKWGLGIEWSFSPIGALVDLLFYYIISILLVFIVHKLRVWNKYSAIPYFVGWFCFALIVVLKVGVFNYRCDPTVWRDMPLTRSVNTISEITFAKYNLKKISDSCNLFFIKDSNIKQKFIIDREFSVSFISDTSESDIEQLLSTEKLKTYRTPDSGKLTFDVMTTENSRYADAITESEYLMGRYKNIQYSEPIYNFVNFQYLSDTITEYFKYGQ